MKKQITIYLLKSIGISFLSAILICTGALLFHQIQNAAPTVGEPPRMNCFPGLGFAILIGISLLLALLSLTSLFNLKERVRKNGLLSFLSFFLLPLLMAIWIVVSMYPHTEDLAFMGTPMVAYFLPWIYFYRRFRLKFG